MAGVQAIAAVCDGIRHLLESVAEDDDLGFSIDAQVYQPSDFSDRPVTTGVSIFLYRVVPNLNHRTPAGPRLPDGRRRRTRLPLDLHLLLTAWGQTANSINIIVAWMMRTLEDYPSLPAPVLNLDHPGTFAPDERVELAIDEMDGEELLHLWELLGTEQEYHVSVPYLARAVLVDSNRIEPADEPVQVRALDMGVLESGP